MLFDAACLAGMPAGVAVVGAGAAVGVVVALASWHSLFWGNCIDLPSQTVVRQCGG